MLLQRGHGLVVLSRAGGDAAASPSLIPSSGVRLLALNGRYFGKARWDPNVLNAPRAVSWWGPVCGGVVVVPLKALREREWECDGEMWPWKEVLACCSYMFSSSFVEKALMMTKKSCKVLPVFLHSSRCPWPCKAEAPPGSHVPGSESRMN